MPSWSEVYLPWQVPFFEMVYDLFILSLREYYLLHYDSQNISFWSQKGRGVVELKREKKGGERFHREVIFLLVEDKVHPVEVATLDEDFAAEKYRQYLLRHISYKRSEGDSSVQVYADFQRLSAQEKRSPTGLTFLYAAFSHQKSSKNFLRQVIELLKGREEERFFLGPFYHYARETYGLDFLALLGMEKGPQKWAARHKQQQLKGPLKEEHHKEFVEVKTAPLEKRKQNQIDFYLQQAKEQGLESEEFRKKLILE